MLAYLAALNQPFREDASNADPRFTRNRIRHELLPLLKTFNPDVVSALAHLAEHADEAHEIIERPRPSCWRRPNGRGPGTPSSSTSRRSAQSRGRDPRGAAARLGARRLADERHGLRRLGPGGRSCARRRRRVRLPRRHFDAARRAGGSDSAASIEQVPTSRKFASPVRNSERGTWNLEVVHAPSDPPRPAQRLRQDRPRRLRPRTGHEIRRRTDRHRRHAEGPRRRRAAGEGHRRADRSSPKSSTAA